jgi:hypothetical protein
VIEARTRELDNQLRADVFKKALEYRSFDFQKGTTPGPQDITRYREQLDLIKNASDVAGVPYAEISAALAQFYSDLERVSEITQKARGARGREPISLTDSERDEVLKWTFNGPTIDRISEHLELLSRYVSDRDKLSEAMNRFLQLVNRFFEQTGKRLVVADVGRLSVDIDGVAAGRDVAVLSSGERQLLIILAQLSLNPQLGTGGVFIVDEPELSLHLAWQELFVDAIMEANVDTQFILATHSPAIILDRGEYCRDLR